MISPTSGLLRLARAGTFAVTAVILSLVAHVVAGGESPGVGMLAATLGVALLPAIWLTGRRRGVPLLMAFLGVGQFALHNAFMAFRAGGSCMVSGGGHRHGTGSVVSTCSGMPSATGGHASLVMLLAHVLTTVALAALLALGERILWRVGTWLRAVIPARPGHASAREGRTSCIDTAVHRSAPWVAGGGTMRRGPPTRPCLAPA